MQEKVIKSDAEWRKELSPEQYRILRQQGTEPAFTGVYWDAKDEGMYRCAACGAPLFASDTKYDSRSGWPSFFDAVDRSAVLLRDDDSLGMHRIEVVCARCESHLGHVFDDGPAPTGKRFCINSAALDFEPKGD